MLAVQLCILLMELAYFAPNISNLHIYNSYLQIHLFFHVFSATQLCWTLYNPTDHSLPCSSVHGIVQARILELEPMSLTLKGKFFTTKPTRGAPTYF